MAFCYEDMGEYAKAAAVFNQIADNLEGRGFEAEVNWPRSLAHKCREKMNMYWPVPPVLRNRGHF